MTASCVSASTRSLTRSRNRVVADRRRPSISSSGSSARPRTRSARTSNPGARDLQDLDVGGRPLYERVVSLCVERFPAERCGFVVGATYPDEARRLRSVAPDRLFLLPGVGAQGGELALAIRAALDAQGGGVLPSASRSVIYAAGPDDFERNAATAARSLRESANAARSAAMSR